MSGHGAGATTRSDIQKAAYRVLLRDGPDHLTLDAVVRESGRSKGGVLYHFPNKEALLDGMVGYVLDRFDADVAAAHRTAGDASPGSWLRAYLAASAHPTPETPAVGAGLLAVIAAHPLLLDRVRRHADAWQARLEADGLEPVVATVARLAIDGLATADLFALAAPQGDRRDRVVAAIADLSRSTAP